MVFSIDFSGKVRTDNLRTVRILSIFPQNYVVTGGNRGIGLAITRSIADAGGSVAILYRSSPDADQVAAKLSKEFPGQEFKAYKCDVTDQARVQEVFHEVSKDFKGGMIHGVVAVSQDWALRSFLSDVILRPAECGCRHCQRCPGNRARRV